MKLITDSNLELVIQKFYERIVEEFSVIDSADKLTTGRNLTIGESSKFFDGTQDIIWSLPEIGVGSPSNLTTSNKTNIVAAVNELNANKASITYVDNAIDNVTIDDAVIAVELVGNVEDVEMDFVTQEELDDALSNLGDIDIQGMVTAVDVGNVDIEQGGGNGGVNGGVNESVIGELSSLQTANKTNLVGAINELFQNANNGKQLIADAIGSPLNSGQTFSAMSEGINGLLSIFKTNMSNLGITIDSNDKFQSLIEKLEAGGGRLPVWSNQKNMVLVAQDFPEEFGRTGHALAAVNNNIYVTGGYHYRYMGDEDSVSFNTIYCYDTIENSWTAKNAVIPKPLSHHGAATVNDKIYIICGWDDDAWGETNSNYCYDPVMDTSTSKHNMSKALEFLKVAVVNNQIYVLGGSDSDDNNNITIYKYDPTSNAWTTAGNLPLNLVDFAAAVVNNQLYIMGGYNDDTDLNVSSVYYYNPSSRSWTSKRNMPVAMEDFEAVGLDNKIYTFLGMEWSEEYQDDDGYWMAKFCSTYCYSLDSDSWTEEGQVVPSGLMDAKAIEVDGRAYIIGGSPVSPYYTVVGDSSKMIYCYIP